MDQTELTALFAANVKRLLKERGLNQTELAKRLEWSTGNVSRLLTGKRSPGADTIAKVSTALDCEPCDLLCKVKDDTDRKPKRKT